MRKIDSQSILSIMLVVTFLVPFAVIPGTINTTENAYSVYLFSLVWRVMKWSNSDRFEVETIDPEHPFDIIGVTLMTSLFSIIFAIQVSRYCNNKTSYRITLFVGILGVLQPLILSLSTMLRFWDNNIFIFIGPIPIQFIIGLILMRVLRPPDRPWKQPPTDSEVWDEVETIPTE